MDEQNLFSADRTADRYRYQLAVVAIGYYAFRLWVSSPAKP
jgi:hypothetical protein